jgi:hypothetical protein
LPLFKGGYGVLGGLVIENHVVVPQVPLGERGAFTLDCVHNDHMRATGDRFGLIYRFADGLDVMTVDPLDMPVERGPFVFKLLDTHDFVGQSVDLHLVVVREGDEPIGFEMSGGHGGFPVLTFLTFTVADTGIHPVIMAVQTLSESDAHSRRETLTQGAGGHINAGSPVPVAVARETGSTDIQSMEPFFREKTFIGQNTVQCRPGMPLGHDKPVPTLHSGFLGIDVHLFVIEDGEHLNDRE